MSGAEEDGNNGKDKEHDKFERGDSIDSEDSAKLCIDEDEKVKPELTEIKTEQDESAETKPDAQDVKNECIKTEIKNETSNQSTDKKETSNDDENKLNDETNNEEVKEEEQEDEEEAENVVPPPKVDIDQLYEDPDFATISSFFNKFSCMIGLKQMTIEKLEKLFTTYENNKVPRELIDIHIQLLRKIRFLNTRYETWELYLKRFLGFNENTSEELLKVERFGYAYIPITSKLKILKALCESQFEYNLKLREAITTSCRTVDLRLVPVGTDCHGLSYWYQQDNDCNVRMYTEEADDHCGGTWQLIVKSEPELSELITKLEAQDLGYDKKLDPLEKQKEKDAQNGKPPPVGYTDKYGTYLDTFVSEDYIKELKENIVKDKELRLNKRLEKDKKKEVVESDSDEKEVEKEIPEELLEDRRILPRRGASIRAVSNLKKVLTPVRKNSGAAAAPKKKKSASVSEDDEEEAENEDEEELEDEEMSDDEASSGDEFKPKSERKRGKKRRIRKKPQVDVDLDEEDDSDDEEEKKERKKATEENACGRCKKSTDWDVLLLCDCCDDAWHTYCLKPVLWFVPDGDWFCPKCKHGRLIDRLKEVHKHLLTSLEKKAIEEKKKNSAAERLRREMEYVGISFANIIPMPSKPTINQPSSSSESDDDGTQRKSKRKAVKKMSAWNTRPINTPPIIISGRRSCRQRNKVDYKAVEFDQMIDEAVANIDGAPPPEPKAPNDENGEVTESGEPIPKKPKVVRKPRLNDLDKIPDSDDGGEYKKESDPEFSEEEFVEEDSGSDFEEEFIKKNRGRKPVPTRRARRGKRNRSWSGSSTEEEEEIADEWRSGESDSDGYVKRRKKKKVESEDEEVAISSTGRPLRKAVEKAKTVTAPVRNLDDDDFSEEDDDGDDDSLGNDDEFNVNEEEEPEEEEEELPEEDDVDDEEENDELMEAAKKKAPQRMSGAPPSLSVGTVRSKGDSEDDEEMKEEEEEEEEEKDNTKEDDPRSAQANGSHEHSTNTEKQPVTTETVAKSDPEKEIQKDDGNSEEKKTDEVKRELPQKSFKPLVSSNETIAANPTVKNPYTEKVPAVENIQQTAVSDAGLRGAFSMNQATFAVQNPYQTTFVANPYATSAPTGTIPNPYCTIPTSEKGDEDKKKGDEKYLSL